MKGFISLSSKYLFLLLGVIGILQSCSRNPVTGKKELMFMSESQEIALGKESDPSIVASFGLYENPELQAFIADRGNQMAKLSHRPSLPYEFKILDSPVVNAFAVPGGYVYFTRGIMAHFNNEAEFAGVLGHEIGHITAKHSARQQTTQILGQLGLIIGVIASEDFRQYAEVASQGLQLLFLKFSRDHETESDRLGVEYSTKAGYNSMRMAEFFETLHRISAKDGGGSIPTFLSTHPDPLNREQNVKSLSAKWQQGKDVSALKENRDSYLRMIDGLVYGDDPKQGYVENWVFYHPELKFQFPVPRNWKYENSPIQFQMAPADGKALIVLTLGQGNTVDEAANAFVQQYKVQVKDSRRTTVNGYPAMMVISTQAAQEGQQQNPQNTIQLATWFIQYEGLIYVFNGMTYAALFNQYQRTFDETAMNFRKLTEPDKLNRLPERIRVKQVKKTGSLSDALLSCEVPAARHEELAIVNGMKLTDVVQQGSLIKVVSK
jgi:predicted Zn-dependent protease